MAVAVLDRRRTPRAGRKDKGKGQRHLQSLAFLIPGAVLLGAIVIYPAIQTVRYSFYNETATRAVGLANYKSLFSTADTLVALRNNVIWVIVFPFIVTTIGLVLATSPSAGCAFTGTPSFTAIPNFAFNSLICFC